MVTNHPLYSFKKDTYTHHLLGDTNAKFRQGSETPPRTA